MATLVETFGRRMSFTGGFFLDLSIKPSWRSLKIEIKSTAKRSREGVFKNFSGKAILVDEKLFCKKDLLLSSLTGSACRLCMCGVYTVPQ